MYILAFKWMLNPVHGNRKDEETNTLNSTKKKIQCLSLSNSKQIRPMLSTPVDKALNDTTGKLEIKWDGVRAILFYHKG